jgi:hypothetical protein
MPQTMRAGSQVELEALEFEIPEYFHAALIMWVEWKQSRRAQEWEKAYAVKKDLVEMIQFTSTEFAFDGMRDETYGFYVQTEDVR